MTLYTCDYGPSWMIRTSMLMIAPRPGTHIRSGTADRLTVAGLGQQPQAAAGCGWSNQATCVRSLPTVNPHSICTQSAVGGSIVPAPHPLAED